MDFCMPEVFRQEGVQKGGSRTSRTEGKDKSHQYKVLVPGTVIRKCLTFCYVTLSNRRVEASPACFLGGLWRRHDSIRLLAATAVG